MPVTLLAGLARLRLFLMVAGLAWLVGLDAPLWTRVVLVALVLVALALDVVIDEHKPSRHYVRTKQPDDFKTAA
ncbi:hypothetical protein [Streptomyces sp. ME19-01-6]|uniref:hypothetical protein n=1 Tax=Streptomyces sp. ME19-01-6 TaxID=3028686 RepID=UPI0029B33A93|nr:hypothetical protein [Streptomyces sp. ME19-01-6]MDX3230592.1 hypothetical protein [Streptomyces sp. ME19-01-6]